MSRALIPVEQGELQRYMNEVNRYPLLSAEEELELARRFRHHHDLEAAHRLVTSHLRYVVKIAREYGGYGLRTMDLIQEGSVGLMQAVKKFDPEKGFRLSTYAVWWIRATIQEFILRSWSLVKVATTTAQRKLFFNLRKTKQTIDQLDEVEAQAIGEQLGVDTQTVLEMDGRLAGRDDTLNRSLLEDGEELQDRLVDQRDNQEVLLLEAEEERIRREAVAHALATLDPRERAIVQERVMAEHPTTLETLGERLGVSRERVRQLEKRALKKLEEAIQGYYQPLALTPA